MIGKEWESCTKRVCCLPAIVGLTVLQFIGCAEPKYVQAQSPAVREKGGGGAGVEKGGFACDAKFASGICIQIIWERAPKAADSNANSFLFKIFRANLADGTPVLVEPKDQPRILTMMPDMPGMGPGPAVLIQRLDIGTFRASNITFDMAGVWEIRFTVGDANENEDQAAYSISI